MLKKFLMGALSAALIVVCSVATVDAAESKAVVNEKGYFRICASEVQGEEIPILQGERKTDATGNYQYEVLDDGTAQITKYVGTEKDVVIPSELDGKKVTKLNAEAFYSMDVVSVKVPDTVVYIGRIAFGECRELEKIWLSASVAELGYAVFSNCSSLATIEVDEKNTAFVAEDNILYTKNKEELIRYGVGKDKVVIPASVKVIGEWALSHIDVKELVLPEGIISLKEGAFANNHSLQRINFPESLTYIGEIALAGAGIADVYIPKSVTNIGSAAFANCHSMEKIVVDPANTKYMTEEGFLYTKDKKLLLQYVGKKTNVTISEGVEKIDRSAFSSKFTMKELKLPQGLKEIELDAFISCSGLEEITIPASVEAIGGDAFNWCGNLKRVTVLSKNCCYGDEWHNNSDGVFPKEAVLYGYTDSTLQEYAKVNNREFVSIDDQTIIADISMNSWQYPYVKYAVENNLASGKGTDESGNAIFDPESKMTRAEFIQLLYNKEGKKEVTYEGIFSDVPENKWFAKAIVWGYKNNLVSGKDGIFDVNGNITREEVATILYKYAANLKKYDTTGVADLSGYEDADAISGWAVNNMKWAIQYNVMKGRGSKIAARDNASRAECITMLINFINAYEKSE